MARLDAGVQICHPWNWSPPVGMAWHMSRQKKPENSSVHLQPAIKRDLKVLPPTFLSSEGSAGGFFFLLPFFWPILGRDRERPHKRDFWSCEKMATALPHQGSSRACASNTASIWPWPALPPSEQACSRQNVGNSCPFERENVFPCFEGQTRREGGM